MYICIVMYACVIQYTHIYPAHTKIVNKQFLSDKKILFHFSGSINLKVISWKSYSLDIAFFKFTSLFLNSRKIFQALFKHHGIFALKGNLKPLALGHYQQRL